MELPTYGEVVKETDQILQPAWNDLVVINACQIIAEQNDLTLSEQLKIWRPFDV